MGQSPDHPELVFLEALKSNGAKMYTPGRNGRLPRWLVVHDMEYPERPDAAEWTANYFHTGAGGRSVSSHYCADDNSIVQCVLLKDSAWTVGNWQGNDEGINWELAGYASQTREQWLDPFGTAMLTRIAPYFVSDGAKYGIPMRTLSDAQVANREKGVSSHAQLARVFGGSDHTDPGGNFPWDYFMSLLTGTTGVSAMTTIIFCVDKTGAFGPAKQVYRCDGVTAVPVPDNEVQNQTWAYAGLGPPWDKVGPMFSVVGKSLNPPVQIQGANPGVLSHLLVYDMGAFGLPIVEDDGDDGLTEGQVRDIAREEITGTTLQPPTD